MGEQMMIWFTGAIRMFRAWADDAALHGRLLPVEVFVERRYLAAAICTGTRIHWCRFTLPASVLPAGWRICVRYGGRAGDRWMHRYFVIPE
jgi:hypothetical protein